MSSFAFVTYKGKFLLILRDNKPTILSPNCWHLLGGKDEDGESPEQTLLRELKEEANIEPKSVRPLWDRPNPWSETDHQWLYHTPLTDDEAAEVELGDEGQRLDYFTVDQMRDLPLTAFMEEMVFKRGHELEQLVHPFSPNGILNQ